MSELTRLSEILKESPQDLMILEALTKTAILDPVESLREKAVDVIKKYYGGVKGGFVLNSSLYLEFSDEHKKVYVCEMPAEYYGQPSKPHMFIV